ncbi:MAG TPA: hypothetical protein VK589_11385 [Chryseolinea sp.]|nr:hypothetical protein [Chryseolinea sp.]
MKLSLLVVLSILLTACSSDDPEKIIEKDPDPLEGLPDKGAIRFDEPEIGQRSHYIFFQASRDFITKEITVKYLPDTLVLAIVGKESNTWVIKEFLTNSPKGGSWASVADEEIIRHLSIDNDSAYFSKPLNAYYFSFLFVGEARTIPLQPVTDPAPLNPDCLPIFGIESTIWTQYTIDYSQHGQTFSHLNDYFDYTPMATDGSGFMYAYGPSYGMVRWTWVSYWSPDEADGWDLIPN